MSKRFGAMLAALAALALVAAGCASGNSESGGGSGGGGGGNDKKTIKIGYIPWDEDVAVTALWKKVLEDKGYTVQDQQIADAGPTFIGLSKGSIDLFFDGWLPKTHEQYWKKYKDDLTDVNVWYDGATLNLAVPKYMTDVNSVADLEKAKSELNGTITGIEPGAGLTAAVKDAISKYKLSGVTQKTSSTPAMLAALKKATDAKKPIAVALWHPHWAYSAFPIKDLKDPDGALGTGEQIHAIGKKDFAKDFPKVEAMVKNFKMTDAQLASLENEVLQKNKDDHAAGVDAWLKANPDFVKSLG